MTKITALPDALEVLKDADLTPIVQDGVTKKTGILVKTVRNSMAALITCLVDPENEAIPSVNGGDPAKFDISAALVGGFRFANAYTDPKNPTLVEVTTAAFVAQTLTNIAIDSATFLYMNAAGALVQERELQGFDYLRDHVGIAIFTHTDNATITGVSGFTPVAVANTMMSFADLSFCQGAINCATGGQNILSGNAGTLSLDKAQGCWYYHGINARNSSKTPNIKDNAALVAPTLLVGWTVTDNPEGRFIGQTTIPAGVYDDGTAELADGLPQGIVTTNKWVNHRIFMVVDLNQLGVQIGTVVYNSLSEARAGLASEAFSTIPVLAGTTALATLAMRGGATDLSDAGDAEIRQAIPPRATFQ